MWPAYGNHMAWMGVWWVGGLALLVVLVWAVLRASTSSGRGSNDDSPEGILKRRYARGEVDRDEYERRLTDLRR